MSEKNGNTAGNGQHKNNEGRDNGGRFAAGNKGGPGNPFARRTAEMRRAIQNAVTPEEMAAVARVMLKKALEGDVAAAKLLYAYGAGKPTEGADPDTIDAHELEVRRTNVAGPEDLEAGFSQMPASIACEILGAATPGVHKAVVREFREMNQARDALEKAAQQAKGHTVTMKDRPPLANGCNGSKRKALDGEAKRGGGDLPGRSRR